jgi:hypothetical protein
VSLAGGRAVLELAIYLLAFTVIGFGLFRQRDIL